MLAEVAAVGRALHRKKFELVDILTIGYGKDDLDTLVSRCRNHNVSHLIDVRTNAYSRYQPDFRQPELSQNLKLKGFKYTFLGDSIGGKPDWEEVLVAGKVEGELLIKDPRFQKGLDLIQIQISKGNLEMALLCGCSDPAGCHRGLWIAPELEERGIRCGHVLVDGTMISQDELGAKTTRQSSLFAIEAQD